MKRILFVDDEVGILDGLKRMLRPTRGEWETAFASGGEEALTLLDATSFDVLVADMRMPGMDGATLLEIVREKYPSILRFILSGYTELQASLRAVPVAHQFLLKPCDPDSLRAAISRSTSLGDALDSKMLTSLVGTLRDLPSLPSVFSELRLALMKQDPSADQVAQIVERDVALSAKFLQLVNSSFFGFARDIYSVRTAVRSLGISILQNLVVTLEVFRSFAPNEFVSVAYLEEFHRHSQLSARIAEGIAKHIEISPAFVVASYLHDVGKLVIVERTPAHFARSLLQARDEGKPLYEIEERLIHCSHAEVGAYLLGLWGLPQRVVESVAHHHHPRRAPADPLNTALLVYVVNLLAHEQEAKADGAAQAFDLPLLEQAGIVDKLPEWRKIAEAAQLSTAQLAG